MNSVQAKCGQGVGKNNSRVQARLLAGYDHSVGKLRDNFQNKGTR